MYKNNNVDLHFYRHRRSFICRESFSAGTHVHFAGVTLADTGSGRWKCWQLKGPIIHKKWIVITSIPGQYIDEAFANHG